MTTSPPSAFEIFINEQRAELIMFRITLQTFLIRIIAARPNQAEEVLQDLKETSLTSIARMQIDPGDTGTQRIRELVAMKGEEFFQELEIALAEARLLRGEAGQTN